MNINNKSHNIHVFSKCITMGDHERTSETKHHYKVKVHKQKVKIYEQKKVNDPKASKV